jgi:hypothetical protein
MSPRATALALCGLFACSGPVEPTPAQPATAPAQPVAQPTPARSATPETAKAGADGKVSLMPAVNSPAPAKEPPLTQEEIDLIEADPATLSPEMRRKRSFALRRKILQNPDSPTARQLEALRIAYERGELQPQLPDKKPDGGLTLHARNPGNSSPDTPEKAAPAPTPTPEKAP